ncbi:MAG: Asp-tRNA(Asn)/Glu-tRNA(Gln) amidotransferase subunit GatB [Candidatus Kerfeldbacteria bacterium]|nr:Asp-tRNA(Asn)/Glu-tRNA(Gln) amidotransferase subunit GatB [Candidatus Kerfeldbacteria bacterium]
MNLEAVIGLEIHIQLKTKSKMFCRCNNMSEGAAPNTLICPICTGHPGTLPLPNKQAIRWAVMAAQALGCTIPEHTKFDRKHYTYPDLPKGYQISQYDEPIGVRGALTVQVDAQPRTIGITRVHVEEDVGKLLHVGGQTLIDYNRAGTPLVEIVTEPDIRTPAEAKAFLQELRLIMRFLGVSNADMEKGELRCDANISLRPKGDKNLYSKSEIKNLNSFRAVERALGYAQVFQENWWKNAFKSGKLKKELIPSPRTYGYREDTDSPLVEQRDKETSADYRYFPEPDIPPLHFTPEFLSKVRAETPELPSAKRHRFVEMYGLPIDLSSRLVEDRELAAYFEEVVTELRTYADGELGREGGETFWRDRKPEATSLAANWLLNRIPVEHRTAQGRSVPPADLGRLLWMVFHGTVTTAGAMQVYEGMVRTRKGPHALVQELGLERLRDAAWLDPIVAQVINDNPEQVKQYRRGKTAVLQFLIGQVMRKTKGRVDAEAVRQALEQAMPAE